MPTITSAAGPVRVAADRAERSEGASARVQGRMAGALWLMVVFTGAFAFFAVSSVTVAGDAAATAASIVASESLFRLGFAANLAAGVFYLGVTVLLYALLKPVSRTVSLLAAALGVAGVAAGAATGLLQLAPLALLGDAAWLAAFTGGQREALAVTFVGLAALGSGVGMVFFGFQCMLVGGLIARSTYLPRALGVLLALGGASYVAASFAGFVAPEVGARLAPFIVPIALLGEGSLSLWLIAKGVDPARWPRRAARQ